jgi:uncharacterized surface protein with fasciclin (FAS1) repeats
MHPEINVIVTTASHISCSQKISWTRRPTMKYLRAVRLIPLLLTALLAVVEGARPTDGDRGALMVPSRRSEQRATLVGLVTNDPDLDTLEAAVVAAGLVETLNGGGPYTIFAPTDEAFACLKESQGCPGSDYIGQLLTPEFTLHLQNYLLHHVSKGTILSTDLSSGQQLTMLNGETITVRIEDGAVFLVKPPMSPFTFVSDPDVRMLSELMHAASSCYIQGSSLFCVDFLLL